MRGARRRTNVALPAGTAQGYQLPKCQTAGVGERSPTPQLYRASGASSVAAATAGALLDRSPVVIGCIRGKQLLDQRIEQGAAGGLSAGPSAELRLADR